jgi:hypothetical protein
MTENYRLGILPCLNLKFETKFKINNDDEEVIQSRHPQAPLTCVTIFYQQTNVVWLRLDFLSFFL